jgi:glycylpeptide N-tetradecanoyltransferase
VKGIRELQAKDVPAVAELLRTYLNKFKIAPVFSNEEVAHWFIPRNRVVNAYVVEVIFSSSSSLFLILN